MNCNVCIEKYGDNRRPEVINCGHTFCKGCLDTITKDTPKKRNCPKCRDKIRAKITNYGVMDLLQEVQDDYLSM